MKLFLLLFSFLPLFSTQNLTVLDLVASNTQLTIFNSLIAQVPQFKRSLSSNQFTLLAPTDQAFKEFNETNPKEFAYLTGNDDILLATLQCKLSFFWLTKRSIFRVTHTIIDHVLRNTTLDSTLLPARSFLATAEGSMIRLDNTNGSLTVGTGFVMGNINFSFNVTDGVLSLIDSILTPPPMLADVLEAYKIKIFVEGTNLTAYESVTNDLYYYTM
jgi:uncharacterized surface protein with fasciclin (FAS1) repeats